MDDRTQFPKLYSLTKSEKVKEWTIKVTGTKNLGVITITTGFPGSKQTRFILEIKSGKNIGKKNETTPLEQAWTEAESRWNKKIDSGYSEDPSGGLPKNFILPMLAVKYTERKHDIKFWCYAQPKLDGNRAVLQKVGKKLCLLSRKGKSFDGLKHILDELKDCDLNLDGELYSRTVDDKDDFLSKQNLVLTFEKLSGLLRKKKFTKEDKENIKNIIFVVYDVVLNEPFKKRLEILQDYFKKKKFKYIKLLVTEKCKSDTDVLKFHKKYVALGFEGVIIRNADGVYLEKVRSKDLQKYKEFDDAEFKIVGYTQEESSTEKGAIIFVCQTQDGQRFSVRPKGTIEDRRKLFKEGKKYLDMYLTVKFFGYTDDGIPFHATTLHGSEADIRSLER